MILTIILFSTVSAGQAAGFGFSLDFAKENPAR